MGNKQRKNYSIAQILQRDYEPKPVQLEEVLNKNGKHRRISEYTCTDRVILDVLKRELTPIWEHKFSKYSYAYQANKGVQEAIKQVTQYIQEGNVWVAEIDIENFVDNINIGLMLEKLNVLISFGNVFMYQRIAPEIQKTALDIRIGFVHAINNRSQCLNLDIAEIFKPIIVDRAIFTVIHNMEINKNEHFEQMENGGIYLNTAGKRIFIRALEQKLYQKLSIKGIRKIYDTIIRDEIKKIIAYVKNNENYKPFKYT